VGSRASLDEVMMRKIMYMWLTVLHRQMYTNEALVPKPSPFEVEFAIESWKGIHCQVLMKFWQN
jgi:hypothetical protein